MSLIPECCYVPVPVGGPGCRHQGRTRGRRTGESACKRNLLGLPYTPYAVPMPWADLDVAIKGAREDGALAGICTNVEGKKAS